MRGSGHPLLGLLLAPLLLLFVAQSFVAVWNEPALGVGSWSYAWREVPGMLAYRLGALR